MRSLIFLGLIYFVGGYYVPQEKPFVAKTAHLLGAKECTWGPSYWCKNLTTAAGCHATKHCIQTVWIHQKLPPDHSSVCQTCLEMVKEARDQLLSNETQEEIKEVFEGSCKLLPIKVVAKECCKLADEFIPELIDTLASQMNPQVVCSVAGLCNNERVHEMLTDKDAKETEVLRPTIGDERCDGCHVVMDIVEKKFRNANRDQVLQNFLKVCGHMGSLSDACSNIVVTYFNEIYQHLEENLNSFDFCILAGECSAMFHTHANVEITPLSRTGVVPIRQEDDLPCDLCKQLVKHLQDVLVANTTEDEFHRVLQGICKQTKSFKDECTNLVDEYYPIIYDYLTNQLNGSVLCGMIGICPGPALNIDDDVPVIPLLPIQTAQSPLLAASSNSMPSARVGVNNGGAAVQVMPQTPELMQLPIERLMPHTLTIIGDTKLCVFCEYFLHYVQQAITDPTTEEEIKRIVDGACKILPSSINETCLQFVDTYGPAFIALLAQDIDPSVLCPKLSLCPSGDAHNVEVFMNHNSKDKPNCPLCLFAVTSLEDMIKNKRTEENIRKALGTLCSHLSANLKDECNDFVETYTDEIVEACIAQLSPQEICVYLKLCEDKNPPKPNHEIQFGGIIATNEILDRTVSGKFIPASPTNSPFCVLCEFVMSQLDQQLKDNATDEEIKTAVHGICNHLPKSVSKECNDFVNQYADAVIQLLIESLDPAQVCAELKLCDQKKNVYVVNDLMIHYDNVNSPQCTLCKLVMTQIEKALQGKVNEDDILKAVHSVCNLLPQEQSNECNDFINKNGKKIIELLEMAIQPGEVCSLLFFCATDFNTIRLDVRKCAVCEAAIDVMDRVLENPNVDHSLEHVLEKTCRALPSNYEPTCRNLIDEYGEQIFNYLVESTDSKAVCEKIGLCTKRSHLDHMVGKEKCTWGPSFWCANEDNANRCGSGAVRHCQTKVWNKSPISN